MLVEMSLRDRLVCLVDFVGMTLLCSLPLPECSLRLCVPTLFAALLKLFLPFTASALSGAANSMKSAPRRFAAGTTFSRK